MTIMVLAMILFVAPFALAQTTTRDTEDTRNVDSDTRDVNAVPISAEIDDEVPTREVPEYDWMERLSEEERALLRRAISMMNSEQLRMLEARGIEYARMFIERVRNMMNAPTQERPGLRPDQVVDETREADLRAERVIRQEVSRDSVLTRAREVASENAAQGLARALENADSRVLRALERVDEDSLRALARAREEDVREITRLSERDIRNLEAREIENENERAELLRRIQKEREIEERGFRVRELPPQAAEQARAKFEEAQQRALQARENFASTRTRITDNQELVVSCVRNPDGERCPEAADISREHIENTLEYVIETLEAMIERVESSEHLSEEDANAYVSRLRQEINRLRELAERLESANDFSEIRDIGREANTVSSSARERLEVASQKISVGRMNSVIVQSNALVRRLEMMTEDISVEERDSVEDLIDRFYNLVRDARARQSRVNELLSETEAGREHAERIREANELSREISGLFNSSREVLREIFAELN